jgi:hypothetical protein
MYRLCHYLSFVVSTQKHLGERGGEGEGGGVRKGMIIEERVELGLMKRNEGKLNK